MQDPLIEQDKQAVIFCDFDGTVTTTDVTDLLLEKLALPEWRDIEERWVKGEIDDCQCMAEQVALIQGDWTEITSLLDTITIDPYFKEFADLCKQSKIPVYIGSSGIDRVIRYILDRENIRVDATWSYHLVNNSYGWSLEFPKASQRGICQAPLSAACKCVLLEPVMLEQITHKKPHKIVIGDSKSDFCWSNKADLVLAKKKLAQYCAEQNIHHLSFNNFADINKIFIQQNLFS